RAAEGPGSLGSAEPADLSEITAQDPAPAGGPDDPPPFTDFGGAAADCDEEADFLALISAR
ncbi:MAG: hypothetical protein IJ678_07675, partial [Kiritimatiellae bacterium]|nr:hypothetical protein [Kiritimatiellia bacterium]